MISMETTPEELFMLIGEREFIKFRQAQEIARLNIQIEEMSKEITRLRNGELGESAPNDTV